MTPTAFTARLAAAAALSLTFAGLAGADQPSSYSKSMGTIGTSAAFAVQDVNGDGYITKSEANADLKARWKEADEDQNGKVDRAEFSALESVGTSKIPITPSGGGASKTPVTPYGGGMQ
jgi:EF hand